MLRGGSPCPSCREPMPRGLELCLFFNAPLKLDSNVVTEETPQPTDVPRTTEVVGPETRPVKSQKVRRTRDPNSKAAVESATQKQNSNAVLLASQRRTAVQLSEAAILGASRAAVDASSTKAKIVAGIVVLLLLAPLIVSGPVPGDSAALAVTWPMVQSGAEPHQLTSWSN